MRVPKFIPLPNIPQDLDPKLKAYLQALHSVIKQILEPSGAFQESMDQHLSDLDPLMRSHIFDTDRDDHTQYLNITRHDTTTRHPLGSVVPTSETPPPPIGTTSGTGVANAVARADHTHAHGDFSGLPGTFHDWNQISNKPATFPPSAHASTHASGGSDALTGNLDANARVGVMNAGTLVGTRRRVNFIAGTNVSLNAVDDATNEKVDVTISAPLQPHNLLSGAHADTQPTLVQRGMLIVGQLIGTVIKWAGLALGAAGKFLKSTGTDVVWGDVDWTEVQNKPSTFPPSPHTHNAADVAAGRFGANTGGGDYSFPNNVGIGTPTPNSKLHIIDNVGLNIPSLIVQNNGARASLRLYGKSTLDAGYTSATVQFYDQDTSNNAHIVFESRSTESPVAFWINGYRRLGIYGGGVSGLSVGSYSGTVPPSNGMIIPGNVGIGTSAPTARLHVVGSTGYNQLRLQTPYTPSSSADPNGNVGDIAWDNNYIYVKTSAGWKRAALSTF
jgi:hypothetical protein